MTSVGSALACVVGEQRSALRGMRVRRTRRMKERQQRRRLLRAREDEGKESKEAAGSGFSPRARAALLGVEGLALAGMVWRGFFLQQWWAVVVVGSIACVSGFGMWKDLATGCVKSFNKDYYRESDPGGFWVSVISEGVMYGVAVGCLFWARFAVGWS